MGSARHREIPDEDPVWDEVDEAPPPAHSKGSEDELVEQGIHPPAALEGDQASEADLDQANGQAGRSQKYRNTEIHSMTKLFSKHTTIVLNEALTADLGDLFT